MVHLLYNPYKIVEVPDMNYHHKMILFAFAMIFTTGLLSCSDSESKLKMLPGGQTAVVISLSLPPENPSAYDNTIWNRIRRIFVRDAIAQTPPATFSSISVTVTGADMATVQQNFSPGATIQLEVPSGDSRQFAVLATVDPADPSAALSFAGTATANLAEGQTISLPITMALNETKIVVPDPGSLLPHNRFFQINDISGAGLTYVTGPNIGFAATFVPWDIDFDSRGRIYIATNSGGAGGCRVIRINNINSTSNSLVIDNSNIGIVALAVDRVRNYVYLSPSNPATATFGFRRCNLDGTGATGVLPVTGVDTIQTITGMDVDSTSGLLYISGKNASGLDRIFQYDPVTQSVTRVYSSANLNASQDVRVMSPYVYVANPGGVSNLQIIQLDTNLNFVAGYGNGDTVTVPRTAAGQFYAARHFVGIRNDSLIIMDDSGAATFPMGDKLVSINNISGAGWTTFPTSGDGQSLFYLYYSC